MVIRVRALSRRAQHHDTKSPQPEAAGEAVASDATHGAAVLLGYLEGRQIPEQDTLTTALHQLLHRTQQLETRLGELESVKRRAVELQRTVELLRADNEPLQLTTRRLEIGFRRHISERVSPDQLKLALTPAATAAPSDPAGPEPDQGDAEARSSARVGAEPPAQQPPPGSESDPQPPRKRAPPYARFLEAIETVRFPGGESMEELRVRAFAALEQIAHSHAGAEVAVVTHQVVTRVRVCAVLGIGSHAYWRIGQDTACLNVIEHKGGYRLKELNAVPGVWPSA